MAKAKQKKEEPAFEQVTGRVDEAKRRRLDQIIGANRSVYKQTNLEDYKSYLKTMNLSDMQAHAHSLGLVPVADRKRLETNLQKEFTKTTNRFYGAHQAIDQPNGKKLSDVALQIMSQGR